MRLAIPVTSQEKKKYKDMTTQDWEGGSIAADTLGGIDMHIIGHTSTHINTDGELITLCNLLSQSLIMYYTIDPLDVTSFMQYLDEQSQTALLDDDFGVAKNIAMLVESASLMMVEEGLV
jgi:hypothetical protein